VGELERWLYGGGLDRVPVARMWLFDFIIERGLHLGVDGPLRPTLGGEWIAQIGRNAPRVCSAAQERLRACSIAIVAQRDGQAANGPAGKKPTRAILGHNSCTWGLHEAKKHNHPSIRSARFQPETIDPA
jgi:hypothetical protein